MKELKRITTEPKKLTKVLCEAETRGFLTVELSHNGTYLIIDKDDGCVAIVTSGHNRPREKVILPISVAREVGDALEVLCG